MTKPKRKGRRPLLTPELQSQIVDALQAGAYLETAAQYAGVSRESVFSWLSRGRAEEERLAEDDDLEPSEIEERYLDFLHAVEKARSRSEVRSLALVQKAAQEGTWQAAAWYLERSFPKRYGRYDRHEHSGPDGGAVPVAISIEGLEAKVRQVLGDE